jgi:hypothetical protein
MGGFRPRNGGRMHIFRLDKVLPLHSEKGKERQLCSVWVGLCLPLVLL